MADIDITITDQPDIVLEIQPGIDTGITQHNLLDNLEWSVAGHIIDTDIDMDDNSLVNVGYEDFTTTEDNPAHQEGRLFYDKTKDALSYYNAETDVTLNIGQEVVVRCCNETGSLITNGSVVYVSGYDSGDGGVTIALATAQEEDKSRSLLMVTHDIEDGTVGYATRLGEVGDVDTSSFSDGQEVYLSKDTAGAFTATKPDNGAFLCKVGIVRESAVSGSILFDPNSAELTVEVTDTNGFPSEQRSGTTISFVDGTRTFTIAPTGSDFHFYEIGYKYEKTSSESVVITDVEGLHTIYYDEGVLTEAVNPNEGQMDALIRTKCLIADVYWDATNSGYIYLGDERHGISMSPETHSYLHFTQGAKYLSGLALNNIISDDSGNDDVDAQFGVDAGFTTDEDLITVAPSVGSTTGLPIHYLDGANGDLRKDTNAGFSVLTTGTGRLAYNEWTGATWQLTEVVNKDFVLCHVFSTNDINTPQIAFVGQNTYATLTQARAGANDEIADLLVSIPAQELVPVGTVIFQTSNAYLNSVKARIRTTDEGENYVNWTTSEVSGGTAPTSHNNLANLELAGTGSTWGHIDDQAQTIAGVKTFSSSPVVPTPSSGTDVANKDYVDDNMPTGGLPAGYIDGGIISNNSGAPDSTIDVAASSCRSSDDTQDIINAADTLSILTGSDWASGTTANEFNPSTDGKTFVPTPQDAYVITMWMSPDRTKMYLPGGGNQLIFQYTLSTAGDISSATYDNKSFDYTAQDTGNAKICMSQDGTKLYLAPSTTDDVYQYTLSTAWDVSTASYDSKTLAVSDTNVGAIWINNDGTKFFVSGQTGDDVFSYSLSTAYDISTASQTGMVSNSDTNNVGAIWVSDDGVTMWLISNGTDEFVELTMSTPWDADTATSTGNSFATGISDSGGGYFDMSTFQAWVVSNSASTIYQFSSTADQTDMTIHTWADYNSGTERYVFDDATGSNISGAKRIIGYFSTDGSADIIADSQVQILPEPYETRVETKADKSNVLGLDNTTSFTPDADYEPATKKYVDDNASGGWTLLYDGTTGSNRVFSETIKGNYEKVKIFYHDDDGSDDTQVLTLQFDVEDWLTNDNAEVLYVESTESTVERYVLRNTATAGTYDIGILAYSFTGVKVYGGN